MPHPVIVNVEVSEPGRRLNSECYRDNYGSIDATRLTNSDVFQNPDPLDLAILLQEFKNLFSDVPYRRIQTYYDLDVGNVVPV